jgi:hypothetical protein
MAFGFVDGVSFTAASSGTGSFVVGSSRPSFRTPAQAVTDGSLVDGQTVSYLAQDSLASPTQREWGHGTFTAATSTVARTTVLGTGAGGTTTVNFTVPPIVSLTALGEDFSGGGGTPGGSSGNIQYNNSGAFGGFGFADGSANTQVVNTTTPGTAQSLTVYNTWSGGALPTPTNYQRGTFDFTTTANTLTIGSQGGGTFASTEVPINMVVTGTTVGTFTKNFIGSGQVGLNLPNGHIGNSSPGNFFYIEGTYIYFGGGNGNYYTQMQGNTQWIASSTGTWGWANSTPPAGAADTAMARVTAAEAEVNNGTAAGVAYLRLNGIVVASLPAASATYQGARGTVTNSNATLTAGIGAVVAGGGTNIVPVFCDGTNWRIG